MGYHFLLQYIKVKSESEVAQSCPTLSNPTDCGPPGSSVHGIFQARVLEWGAIVFSVMCAYYVSKGGKYATMKGFPGGSDGKGSACNAGDLGSISGLGRFPGEEHSNPLQYSCLENSMGRGAWWATVHGVKKSWTQLSD